MFENMAYARGGVKNNEEPLQWSCLKSSRTVRFLVCLLIKCTYTYREGSIKPSKGFMWICLSKHLLSKSKTLLHRQNERKYSRMCCAEWHHFNGSIWLYTSELQL